MNGSALNAACLLGLLGAGCAGELGDSAPYVEARLAQGDATNQPVGGDPCVNAPPAFLGNTSRCAACHDDSAEPLGGLDLLSADLESRVMNVEAACPPGLLADPSDPAASTLVLWTRDGTEACSAPSMPPVGEPLNLAELECLLTWIDNLDGVVDRVDSGVAP
ncbi:MAG: hypothetical protein AAF654_14375 [Myxococcota bacterium]